jgi:predicted N-acetyltransferase YhbS
MGEFQTGVMLIRPARPGEDVTLTDLTLRASQQHWKYPDEFMAWEPEHLVLTPDQLTTMIIRVLEDHGRVIGYYALSGEPPEMELSRMMVEPGYIGSGCGRILWDDAVETARHLGANAITLDSDPNAEGFYRRMGAVTVGEQDWTPPMMPEWRVKMMRYTIPASEATARE